MRTRLLLSQFELCLKVIDQKKKHGQSNWEKYNKKTEITGKYLCTQLPFEWWPEFVDFIFSRSCVNDRMNEIEKKEYLKLIKNRAEKKGFGIFVECGTNCVSNLWYMSECTWRYFRFYLYEPSHNEKYVQMIVIYES